MPKSKNVVIRVTPKQAERWRQAAALAGAEHYTSWAREQVDAAVRRARRSPPPGERRDPSPTETRAAGLRGNRGRGEGRRHGRNAGKLTASCPHARRRRENCETPRLDLLPLMGDEHRQDIGRIPPTLVGLRNIFTLLFLWPFRN